MNEWQRVIMSYLNNDENSFCNKLRNYTEKLQKGWQNSCDGVMK